MKRRYRKVSRAIRTRSRHLADLPAPGGLRATRKQDHWPAPFPSSTRVGAVPSGRSDYRRFRRAIECSGRRGIRKFDGQFPKRGGLACARSNRSCPQVWAASFLGAGHDRVITSAIRGVVSQHPGIPTVLKTQLLRLNWTELNWRLAGSTPVSATMFS